MSKLIGRVPVEIKKSELGESHFPVYNIDRRLWETISTGSLVGTLTGSTFLRISGSTGSDAISLFVDDLLITGSNGVTTIVTDNTITVGIPDGVVSSSAQAVSWSVASASYANNAETLNGLNSAVFATTGSNVFTGNQTINGSLLLTNLSSSINIFGTELADEHQFTGSVSITGSLEVDSITGSLFGTASYALSAETLGGFSASIYATTGSNIFTGDQTINGQIIVVDITTSSINIFGDDAGDQHIFTGSVNVSGSIQAHSITGSLFGTSTTASYVEYTNIGNLPALVSSSAQINTGSFTGSFIGDGSQLTGLVTDLRISGSTGSDVVSLLADDLIITGSNGVTTTVTDNTITIAIPEGTVSSSAQINTGSFTGSFIGDGSQLTGLVTDLRISGSTGSDIVSLLADDLLITGSNGVTTTVTDNVIVIGIPDGVVSSSAQAVSWSVASASYANNADTLDGLNSTVFATTGSNVFYGNQTINGAVLITDISASINTFGASLDDEHIFTGSVSITGSLEVQSITGSLFGTASYALFAETLGGVDSSGFATTGSNVFSGSQTINGQLIVVDTTTSSVNIFGDDPSDQHIFTGSLDIGGTITATDITSSLFGTASYALTASFALNSGIDTSSFATTGSNIFVGNQIITGSLDVSSTFSAQSKSFKIIHPTKIDKFLVYGSLESPYHGVRLTGEGELSGNLCKIILPDYITGLCLQENAQVQITNIKHDKVLWVEDIVVNENYFTVSCNRKLSDNTPYKFYWSFTAIRKDIEKLDVEIDI
jgi:hypothetical protein